MCEFTYSHIDKFSLFLYYIVVELFSFLVAFSLAAFKCLHLMFMLIH